MIERQPAGEPVPGQARCGTEEEGALAVGPRFNCPACGTLPTANERYCTRCGRSLFDTAPGAGSIQPRRVMVSTPCGGIAISRVILSIHFLAVLPVGLILTAIGLILALNHLTLLGVIVGAIGLCLVAWAVAMCAIIARMGTA